VNNLGDVLATYWTAIATADERLGAFITSDEVMTRTQETVTLTIHADCTVLASLGQRDYAHTNTQTLV